MKKITYILTGLIFFIFTIQPASANYEVVMGLGGPQVVTNSAPPASFGPTVGGHNGARPNAIGGSFGVVSPEGDVTNIIVCHSFCSDGTFGPSGDTVAPQILNSNVGIWWGPGTTKYNRETETFTITIPFAEEMETTNGDSSTKIFGNKTLTFVAGNIFVDNSGVISGYVEGWADSSTANISTTKNNIVESLNLGTRKNELEIKDLVVNSELLSLNEKVDTLISLLGNWVK